MSEKYLNVDLDDPRTDAIAEVMSNKTCRKILGLLSEKEMSEGDIAKSLNSPLNTVGYNIKKLSDLGLIEKSKTFFWSAKGKRIPTYRVANKKIVITPKTMFRGILPALVASVFVALVLMYYFAQMNSGSLMQKNVQDSGGIASSAAPSIAVSENYQIRESGYDKLVNTGYAWLWFLLGALVALFVFMIWNWRKIW